MPNYQFICEECEHIFHEYLKMDDRKIPEGQPCPNCGEEGHIRQHYTKAPHYGDPFALGRVKLDDGMKNVLDKVRKVPGASHVKSRFEDM